MGAADVLQPFLIILGLIAAVAAVYFIVTAIKGRASRSKRGGGKHSAR